MNVNNLGNKTKSFLFKMQPAIRDTLEINAKRVGMSKAEYIINLIINDSPHLKGKHKSLKKLKKDLIKMIKKTI